MQRFCEDCGSPLSPGMAFCENCGAKIDTEESAAPAPGSLIQAVKDSARPPLTQTGMSSPMPAGSEQGIIYTNLKLLCAQLPAEESAVRQLLDGFIADASARGISYTLMDVSPRFSGTGTVAEHVAVIRGEVEKSHAKYLLILGSSSVIPTMVWTNEAGDKLSDKDVASDLPYSTLDTASPFGGQRYDFDEVLRTGRLPNVSLATYFNSLKAGCGMAESVESFAMSTEDWKNETQDIYKNISAQDVLTSPECKRNDVTSMIPAGTNVFLFNLHGSNWTEFWYGQRGSSYPEALAPTSFGGMAKPYFVTVEACYGAAYEGRKADKSVLLSALGGKCISFLGSSRIAFGSPSAPGCCADIICCEHLKGICSGMTAGDSLALARKTLMKDDADAETIKTLAEFSLYGDPSARLLGTGARKSFFASRTADKSFAKGIRIPQPDVRRAVRTELCAVEKRISDAVEAAVYGKYPELAGCKAQFWRNANSGAVSAVFSKQQGQESPVAQIVAVSLGAGGQIQKIMESK